MLERFHELHQGLYCRVIGNGTATFRWINGGNAFNHVIVNSIIRNEKEFSYYKLFALKEKKA